MSIIDTTEFEEYARTAADDVAARFSLRMAVLFDEVPEAFEGRSSTKEWLDQVKNAKEWLEDAIADEILKTIELAESRLHSGEFLAASVACRRAAGVV